MTDPVATTPRFDVVIVGAGIAGASLAWHLAEQCSVLLVEREVQPGLHSTGRSAAMFMETYGSPQARALTRASRLFYEQPPSGFTDRPLLSPRGALYVAWQGQEQALTECYETLRKDSGADHPVRLLSAEEALAMVPVLKAQGLIGGVLESDAMDIDVHALHQGYLSAMKRRGATLETQAELHGATFDPSRNEWTIRYGSGKTAHATTLVNAAGAWADECASRCTAHPIGIQPKRRSAMVFEALNLAGESPAAEVLAGWPTVSSIDVSWYIKPESGLLLGSPANADPVIAHDVQAEELDIALAIAAIEDHTTLRIRRPRRVWAGLRSFAPDEEMVIGWDCRQARFFWLAGQGGYGIQSADAAAELAASLILGQPLPQRLAKHGVNPSQTSPSKYA
jgi:D-arginine dehydrogenase